jgi:hypothetical protein
MDNLAEILKSHEETVTREVLPMVVKITNFFPTSGRFVAYGSRLANGNIEISACMKYDVPPRDNVEIAQRFKFDRVLSLIIAEYAASNF